MNFNDNVGADDGDFNGDGFMLIGVIASDWINAAQCSPFSRPPSGDNPFGLENVIVTNTHAGRMNIFGCSVTIHALDPGQPVITVQDAVGKVTLLDIHVKQSSVQGYLIKNNADLVIVKNSSAMFNDIGFDIEDNDVEITGSPHVSNNRIGILVQGGPNVKLRTNNEIIDNTQYGVLITGDGNASDGSVCGGNNHPNGTGIGVTGNVNYLHNDKVLYNTGNGMEISGTNNKFSGEDAQYNGGIGILVSGNSNTFSNSKQIKCNIADGIRITGDTNTLEGNESDYNGGNGIKADEADGANGNTLKNNIAKYNSLQGILACGQTDLGNNVGQNNMINPQVDFACIDPFEAKFLVVDISADKSFLYDAGFNFISSKSLDAANSDANDVTVDGINTYVIDKNDKKVYRYVGGIAASKVLKDISGGSLGTPSGAVIDGSSVYIVDLGKDMAFQYDMASLFSGTGNLNAAAQYPLNSLNLNATGITVGNSINLYKSESEYQPESEKENQQTPGGEIHFLVYPNPTQGDITVEFICHEPGRFSVKLYDMTGRIVISSDGEATAGLNTFMLHLTNYIKGLYILDIETSQFNKQKIVIVQ